MTAEFVSVVEAARRLGWHTNTVRLMIDRGIIPAIRSGITTGTWRIPVAWIEAQKATRSNAQQRAATSLHSERRATTRDNGLD